MEERKIENTLLVDLIGENAPHLWCEIYTSLIPPCERSAWPGIEGLHTQRSGEGHVASSPRGIAGTAGVSV